MVSLGQKVGQGDTLALTQETPGVTLVRLQGMPAAPSGTPAAQTSGAVMYIVDGAGTVKGTYDMNGNISAAAITGTTITGTTGTFTSIVNSGGLTGKAAVISGSAAGPTALTAAQSGSVVLGDATTGQRFTLPAPAVGLVFEFLQTATIASSNFQVDTDAGTTFLVGMVNSCIDAAATDKPFAANGTSHTHIICNGSTTGGIKGQWLKLVCVDATHWLVTGTIAGSSTLATPFS